MLNGKIITNQGAVVWYKNGLYHREDGPAYEFQGLKTWWFEGQRHRIDGPAVDYFNFKEWYYHGKKIECSTQEQFEKMIKLKAFL